VRVATKTVGHDRGGACERSRVRGLACLAVLAGTLVVARPADAMVRFDRPYGHRSCFFGLFGSGLESYGFDPGARSNVLGGGLFLTIESTGGFPLPWSNGQWNTNWAFDLRARHLTSYDSDHERTSLAIDGVIRISKIHYPRMRRYKRGMGRPRTIYEANAFIPYVGAGATLAVPLSGGGKTHPGAVAVAGFERWFAKHAGVHVELELRGMVSGGGVVQAGANAGLLLAM
jgi:hypothetical protein